MPGSIKVLLKEIQDGASDKKHFDKWDNIDFDKNFFQRTLRKQKFVVPVSLYALYYLYLHSSKLLTDLTRITNNKLMQPRFPNSS